MAPESGLTGAGSGAAVRLMPLPERLARFNRRVTNPIARRFAGRVPPFGIVVHTGRRTGRRYDTPVWVFRTGNRSAIALTYGEDSDWVRNVLAAGRCELVMRQQRLIATNPRVVGAGEGLGAIPGALRPALRALNVTRFLLLDRADGQHESEPPPDARGENIAHL